jgi:hypothetical protein
MLRVVVCVALLAAGCAVEAPEIRTVTKIVKVSVPGPPGSPGQICIRKPMDAAEVCGTRKECIANPEMTCAEAYYRLTHCANTANNHAWLDGGRALRKDETPNKRGEPDGIPCEDRCGSNALAMRRAIAAKPFTPPLSSKEECRPAS